MTLEKLWKIKIDHCFPVSSFNLSDENEMKNMSLVGIILRPMYVKENTLLRGNKIDYWLYTFTANKGLFF